MNPAPASDTARLNPALGDPPDPATSASGSRPQNVSPHVQEWIDHCVNLCRPDRLFWCDGSPAQRRELLDRGVHDGVFIKLNQQKLPNCYLHRSNTNDVARSEHLTFICTPSEDMAGPTNNWIETKAAYAKLRPLFAGCMRGRTMFVIPFLMGPPGCPLAKVGVQLTDSLYVAVNMQMMTRVGDVAWNQLGDHDDTHGPMPRGPEWTRCLHSLGDVNPDRRYICHFPTDNAVWSFGSGYGGNALLGKKCLALRIAGYLGYQQGWMAEHMLIMGARAPGGEKSYIAAAFPSSCGKTNFAMLIPPEKYQRQGWKITTVGDDIAWLWVNPSDGKLRAINPEAGYFGVAPGTNMRSNPNAMACMSHDAIYTNVALLPDGDVWWEGKTDQPPAECLDWKGDPWTPASGRKAAHPNSRFTAPMSNNPALDESASDPAGVQVTAIIFGGRRGKVVPLVYQAFNWIHGVYLGATLGSEATAAATPVPGAAATPTDSPTVRRDPMAMLPFLGYNIRDYLVHWIRMRRKMSDCPRIFHVNWFRKSDTGKFLWPGYGENMRVLKWIIDRCHGRAYAVESLIGWVPQAKDIDLDGVDVTVEDFQHLQAIDPDEVKTELLSQEELFLKIAGDLPKEMIFQRELLISRL